LFAWLAGQCPGRDAAWDCGCGSGQASFALAEHFTRVHATDLSAQVVGPCWPPQRRHVESNYTTLPFPFEELPHPGFGLELFWSLEQVLG
jgi:ubiquinone/menaquinone biosynthesis C-methylase UbiE